MSSLLNFFLKVINGFYLKLLNKSINNKFKTDGSVKIRGFVEIDNPNIVFGSNVQLYSGVQIWGDGKIKIGNNVAIGKDTIIYAHLPMEIGNDTLIAAQCYIIDSNHGTSSSSLIRKQPLESSEIIIGSDVWIGAGTKILQGSKISDGAIVGASSLVNNKLEPYSINVGIPAKAISYRSDIKKV